MTYEEAFKIVTGTHPIYAQENREEIAKKLLACAKFNGSSLQDAWKFLQFAY